MFFVSLLITLIFFLLKITLSRLHVFVETAVMASCLLNRIAAKARHGKDQTLHTSIKEHSEYTTMNLISML